jgi:NTE family protein
LINKQFDLIERLYGALHQCEHSHLTADQMGEIEKSYDLLVRRYGAKISSVTRIIRKSPERPYSQQNADFSVDTIKQIIKEGELNVMEELKSFKFKEQEYTKA